MLYCRMADSAGNWDQVKLRLEEPTQIIVSERGGTGKEYGEQSLNKKATVPILVHIYCQLQSLSTAASQAPDPRVLTSKSIFFFLFFLLFLPGLVYF